MTRAVCIVAYVLLGPVLVAVGLERALSLGVR
jgi:hypothetical protein